MIRPGVPGLTLVGLVIVCLCELSPTQMQSTGLRRITNTTEEGINLNPSISGDGRIVAFESTEDLASTGGSDQASLPDLIRRVKPSVVSILTYDVKGEPLISGSGFFVRGLFHRQIFAMDIFHADYQTRFAGNRRAIR